MALTHFISNEYTHSVDEMTFAIYRFFYRILCLYWFKCFLKVPSKETVLVLLKFESIRNKSPYQSLRMQCLRMRFRVLTLTTMQKDVYSFVWTLLSFVSKTALTNSCVHKPANLHMMPFLMALIYMACLQQIPCFFEEVFWISRGICQSVLLYTSCRCRCWNLLRLVRVNLVISSLIPFFSFHLLPHWLWL